MKRMIISKGLMLLLVLYVPAGFNTVKAQTPQQILTEIYKKYDSTQYLSFDVKYTLSSDTLLGDFTYEVMEGSYTMAGKKSKYRLGDIEFMQNDSFLIGVYNNDKYIIVSDPKTNNSGSELPLRAVVDSLLDAYGSHYIITVDTLDSLTGMIGFLKNPDSTANFLKFAVTYDFEQLLLRSVEYSFNDQPYFDSVFFQPAPRIHTLKVEFLKYRLDNYQEADYDQNKYIFFEDGLCKPVERYRDYKVFYTRTGQY